MTKVQQSLKLSSFQVPKNLIAGVPASPRDSARLLVYSRGSKIITDDYFYNLPKYLVEGSSLVLNNTKVSKARLSLTAQNGSEIEVFILERTGDQEAVCLVRPGKRFKAGSSLSLVGGLEIQVKEVLLDGTRRLKFNQNIDSPEIQHFAHVPLPPYIEQNDSLEEQYDTVFAKDGSSSAAPTAGLHFTEELLLKLKSSHPILEVNLEVGLGTFAKLNPGNFQNGALHSEKYSIEPEVAAELESAQHITAVGTTSVRTLESAFKSDRKNLSLSGSTDIFITPGYQFKMVDSLVTNFHLPGTSLLYLVAAFLESEDELLRIYNHAIQERYRFFSFGDAMLIL